jgi:hypothetical protein
VHAAVKDKDHGANGNAFLLFYFHGAQVATPDKRPSHSMMFGVSVYVCLYAVRGTAVHCRRCLVCACVSLSYAVSPVSYVAA